MTEQQPQYVKVNVVFDIIKVGETYVAKFKSQTYDFIDALPSTGGATNKTKYTKTPRNHTIIYNRGSSRKIHDHAKYSKTFRRH
jgi:hypothetical protein